MILALLGFHNYQHSVLLSDNEPGLQQKNNISHLAASKWGGGCS